MVRHVIRLASLGLLLVCATVVDAGDRRAASGPLVRPDALHRAVLAGDVDGLKTALKAGADVNARDARDWTALMHAANKGYAAMVGLLLEAKAYLDARAPDGATALFIAALRGRSEVVVQLMRKGADASIPGPLGKLPLEVARDLQHVNITAHPEIAELQQAGARKKQERKMRDEARRREREESGAFGQAQASNTPSAYKAFLTSWCPGGKLCARARSLLDETIKKALVGNTFTGVDSDGDEARLEFHPSGKFSSSFSDSPFHKITLNDWHVEGEKIILRFNEEDMLFGRSHSYYAFSGTGKIHGDVLEIRGVTDYFFNGFPFPDLREKKHIVIRLRKDVSVEKIDKEVTPSSDKEGPDKTENEGN